ncbi:ADP-ribose pyrophosphatase YjhB (NUDIX family) [Sinobacterium caligoides]|uniref:ADP-ribose pyrophosphatase YjhB (NUDIX family) n=1 Tax=Sinobacterium caligoides TaxID=933926 RepID=A0A3N2DNR8_9GAMM|nr:NUDIX domain-containing protein [Sinobacterium caligoides]ROS01437.1 ADP-ribose pyrophosphatase YjhB (NUDIX family) [Sinobacterium caligoides]
MFNGFGQATQQNKAKNNTAAIMTLLLLSGCKGSIECNTTSAPALNGNAGCLSVQDGKILLVKQRSGKYSIPGGTQSGDESAQCTAMRETAEETGLTLAVGELLTQFDNGFYLFQCTATDDTAPFANDLLEVSKVMWLDIDEVPSEKWRYQAQWPIIETLARKLDRP